MFPFTSFDSFTKLVRVVVSCQNSNKLLGLTTGVSNGGTGIKGFVFTSLHKPSGKTVVVKRYQVDEEHHERNSFHNSQEHFNENVTFIMVRNI